MRNFVLCMHLFEHLYFFTFVRYCIQQADLRNFDTSVSAQYHGILYFRTFPQTVVSPSVLQFMNYLLELLHFVNVLILLQLITMQIK